MKRNLVFVAILACLPAALMADFSYKETTQITGGSLARMMKMASVFSKQAGQPIESTVLLKGNRLAHVSEQHISVIDLDKETITDIHPEKKNYSVITFAEMTKAMQAMQQKYANNKTGEASDAEVNFNAEVKETGKTETISGIPTKEMILTMTTDVKDKESGGQGQMKIVSDMWLANKIAGYDQVKNFYVRMSEKLAFTPGGMPMLPGGAQMARGMSSMTKEIAKLDGVPVRQVVTITGDAAPGASSPNAPPPPSIGEALGGAVGGRLGGLGRFGRKKKEAEEKKEEPKTQSSSEGSLMETTTEMSQFSSVPVDAAKFEVPAGYKQVENPLIKMAEK